LDQDVITIKGARLHNLKNVTLSIPRNKLVVFTGLSGSGKSTLAFDTIHKEGSRQYLESLGLVTWALSKPQVDAIVGLSPSISVDQHLTNRSPRSTVGTVTEVFTYLRVLYARLGHRPCPNCGADIPPSQDVDGEVWDDEAGGIEAAQSPEDIQTYPCPNCGTPVPELGMEHFSFNKPEGACPTCTGLGVIHQARVEELVDFERSVEGGAISGWDAPMFVEHNSAVLRAAGEHYGFDFDPSLPIKSLGPTQRDLLLYGVQSPQFRRHYPHTDPPPTVRKGRFEGVATSLLRRYAEHIQDTAYREKMDKFLFEQTCPECQGTRIRAESRQVSVLGRNIIEVSRLSLLELTGWLEGLHEALSSDEWAVAEAIVTDLRERVRRLVDVGVGYLSLDRDSPTLSAGEAQRLRLAALLGSGLTSVIYILDEPTIGLHPRDTGRLVKVLRDLRDLKNTVLVVEHDLDVMRQADYLVDIGPGAGKHGGRVVAAGPPKEVAEADSLTGQYLSGRMEIPLPEKRRKGSGRRLVIRGARAHNLKNVTVGIPLETLTVVTGVSGSGKSSLIFDILDRAARRHFNGAADQPGEHDAIEGWEFLDKVVTLDQSAIGRTARSNAATYTDAFGPIRDAFASTPEARRRGLTARHFSFNVPGGRCERCEGAGVLTMQMHFLPDVQVRCPACHGRRFRREVLAAEYHGRDIASVLDMTIEEALALFRDVPAAAARLSLMVDVGLGYLQLGQPANTLSGGEAQRVKLAKELSRRSSGRTLYLLDEPTTGLHSADIARLLLVLQRLVDAGNTVVVVEHNLDVIRSADWVIDLGPEGGDAGGELVAEGTPEQVARSEASHTGAYLGLH
jgi:excinuclease ABC subunit A